jgi:hypothetical protein
MKNVLRTIKDQDTLELDDIIKGLEAEEKLAPEPMKKKSRAFYLYDIVRSLGGTTTLNDIWKLTPASDLTKPKNKRELREWISSSCVSKGYIHKVASDVYRIATLEEYERILARNRTSAKKYTARVKAKELRAAKKQERDAQTTLKEEAKETMLKQAAWKAAKEEAREELSVGIESVMPPRAPTPTKPVGRPVVRQPEPKQPEPSRSFANQYLGSLLGTSVAIVLFYVIVRVI